MGSGVDLNAAPHQDPELYQGHMSTSAPRVCGGCAFSDAAAMSAMVTKLQAELAQVKLALQAKSVAEEALQGHRQSLEASVTSLRSEVSMQS